MSQGPGSRSNKYEHLRRHASVGLKFFIVLPRAKLQETALQLKK